MPAGRPPQSSEELARRQRALELYCSVDKQGTRPTLREIAMTIGVTVTAVRYWKTRDRWDEKVNAASDAIVKNVLQSSQDLKTILRGGLLAGLTALLAIVKSDKQMAKDRIDATEALARIAKQFNAVDLDAAPLPTASMGAFDDRLPGAQESCGIGSQNSGEPLPTPLLTAVNGEAPPEISEPAESPVESEVGDPPSEIPPGQ